MSSTTIWHAQKGLWTHEKILWGLPLGQNHIWCFLRCFICADQTSYLLPIIVIIIFLYQYQFCACHVVHPNWMSLFMADSSFATMISHKSD